MKNLFVILSLAAVLCTGFSCQKGAEGGQGPAVDIAAETEALREAFFASQEAGPEKDVDLLLPFVAEDALTSVGDKDAVREWYTNYFSQGRSWDNPAIDKIELSASGDMAYTVCTWEYFDAGVSAGKGSNLIVWKKQSDGTWKMAAF